MYPKWILQLFGPWKWGKLRFSFLPYKVSADRAKCRLSKEGGNKFMIFDVVDFGLLDSSSPVDSYCPLLFLHRLSAVWGGDKKTHFYYSQLLQRLIFASPKCSACFSVPDSCFCSFYSCTRRLSVQQGWYRSTHCFPRCPCASASRSCPRRKSLQLMNWEQKAGMEHSFAREVTTTVVSWGKKNLWLMICDLCLR